MSVAINHRQTRLAMPAVLRALSTSSLLCAVLGALTNKVIAIATGPEGLAVMGLYRSMSGLASRTLLVGFDTVLARGLAASRSSQETARLYGATVLLLILQALALAFVAVAWGGALARTALGTGPSAEEELALRLALVMSLANIALQLTTAVLSGQLQPGRVAVVNLCAAIATLVLIFPLLQLGRVGLALNVGSGSLIGALLGATLIARDVSAGAPRPSPRESFHVLGNAVVKAGPLIVHPFLMMGAVVSVQCFISRSYGLTELGSYSAAMTICDTSLMVLVSSVRSYCIPALANLDDAMEKCLFLVRMQRMGLAAALTVGTLLILGSVPLVHLLFSQRFSAAPGLLRILSVSLVGQTLIWSYCSLMLQDARYGLFLRMDLLWAGVLLAGVAVGAFLRLPMEAIGWMQTASYTLSGGVYAVTAGRKYGREFVDRGNMAIAGITFLWLEGVQFIADSPLGLLSVLLGIVGVAASYILIRSR